MGSEAKRLKSGCWTCRLRRKKCEEGGPPCLTCVNRQIHCHGYGPKPEWKDKGEKERQEAIRLRIRSSRSSAVSAEAFKATPSTASSSPAPATEDDVHLTSHAADDAPRTSTPQENRSNDYGFPMESELGFMDTANLDPIFLADQWNYFDPGLPIPGTPMDQELAMNAMTESNIAPQLAKSPLSMSEPGLNPKSSEREMDLVMHYVDYVSIGDQEPGRRVHGSSKGWLLSTLLRSPGFYNTAISLSAYHQHLKATARGEPGAAAYHDYQKYRLRATQIFECSRPGFLGENLICAVELARLETVGGNRERSQSYLRSALSLLEQPKIQSRACGITASSGLITPTSPSSFSSGTMVTRQAPPPLPSETERKALSHSQALLAWMDILTCSVQRTMPAAHETYRSLLSNSSFCLCFRAVTGCESWILQTIMDVVALDTWKRDQEARRDLSIRQLVKRADEITSAIEANVGDLGAALGLPGQPSLGDSARNDERPGPSLTLLYAQAALVYLNFIVSGPNCGALEVRQSIDCAIASWKSVPLYNRRRLLVWPLLITATLAKGQQRDFFRNLIESCPESRTPGNHYNIWSVVTACWEEVDAQTGTGQTRMKSWGHTSDKHELGLLIC
ncbi:PRO1A C6 Zink-finger protein [Colletotrichum higginsianum]|nr:PRO1A C6 Zink-finger protein [Colletotrichum higginsianum]